MVHYAGVCVRDGYDYDTRRTPPDCRDRGCCTGLQSTYRDRHLGSFGALATFSFHESKNFTSGGEGGLLVINDQALIERAEIIREKGTDRARFLQGQIDKYSWIDIGSSFLPGELQAAHLWAQLAHADEVLAQRLRLWQAYDSRLAALAARDTIELERVPVGCRHNGHLFYLKCADNAERRGR